MSFQLKEFQTLTQKIYTNNESEKDRLKALKDNFAKSEKSIHQAAKKGQKVYLTILFLCHKPTFLEQD